MFEVKKHNKKSISWLNKNKKNNNKLISDVLKSKDAKKIYNFSKKEKNLTQENIDALMSAIIRTQNSHYIYLFARDTKYLTKEHIYMLMSAIIELNNAVDIYNFAKDTRYLNKNTSRIERYLIINIKLLEHKVKYFMYSLIKRDSFITKSHKAEIVFYNKILKELS